MIDRVKMNKLRLKSILPSFKRDIWLKTSTNRAYFRVISVKSAIATMMKIEIAVNIGCQVILIVYLVKC